MRQLLLLRHAKSAWDRPGLSDYARPLAQRGVLAAAAVRRAMQEHGLQPDLVLVSSARRTLQTLEALEPWDETPLIEPMDGLYLAGAEQLLGVLRGTPETVRSAMLVGHNPGVHELAVLLVGAHGMAAGDERAKRLATGPAIQARCLECAGLGPVQPSVGDQRLLDLVLARFGF